MRNSISQFDVFVSTDVLLHRVASLGVKVSELKSFLLNRGLTKPVPSVHAIGKLAAELTLEIPPSVTTVKFHELELRVARAEGLARTIEMFLATQRFDPWSIQVRKTESQKVDNDSLITREGELLLHEVEHDAVNAVKEIKDAD